MGQRVSAGRNRWGAPLQIAVVGLGTLVGGCSRTGLELEDPPAPVPAVCLEIVDQGQGATAELSIDARLRRADVFFLLDTTESMTEEIGEIRRRLSRDIAPLIEQTFPDVEYGVAGFSDFPEIPYGAPSDRLFSMLSPMTSNLRKVQDALTRLPSSDGHDVAEAQVEALYQLATGEGIGRYVAPSLGCPSGGFGAACFRNGARPVVLLFTDAPFHNGPTGTLTNEYLAGRLATPPHTYAQTLAVLRARSIAVIGLWSSEPAHPQRRDLARVALDTGAVDRDGSPLVFDVGEDGSRLSDSVVDAVATFADASKFDVSLVLEDGDPADGVDSRQFVAAVRPLAAVPMSGIAGIDVDNGRFLGVEAGTEVTFAIDVRNDIVATANEPRTFPLRLRFLGDDQFELDQRVVNIVIPADDGLGCAAFE